MADKGNLCDSAGAGISESLGVEYEKQMEQTASAAGIANLQSANVDQLCEIL